MPPRASTSTSPHPAHLRVELITAAWLCMLACGLVWSLEMPQSAWLGPLEAQRFGQLPLVGVRMVALAGALLALRARSRPRSALLAALLAIVFAASLACNAVTFALAALAVWVVGATRAAVAPRMVPLHAAAILVGLAIALSAARASPTPALPADAAGLARHWIARDNPYRALPYATAWARAEALPGAGALALAAVALRLGDADEARRILTIVMERGTAEAQADAQALWESVR